jgi:hypothetical protein
MTRGEPGLVEHEGRFGQVRLEARGARARVQKRIQAFEDGATLLIRRILVQERPVVEEVAIQVDIVLVPTALPGEAKGVEGVGDDQGCVGR